MPDGQQRVANVRNGIPRELHTEFLPQCRLNVDPAQNAEDRKRRLLLVHKRSRELAIPIPAASGGTVHCVDRTTGFRPPALANLSGEGVLPGGYSATMVELAGHK